MDKEYWIDTAYKIFALDGWKSFHIEYLSRKMGISKSSFYHHFGNKSLFISHLLSIHHQRVKILIEKEQKARQIDPEIFNLLIDHRYDIFFQREVRIHRDIPQFQDLFKKTNHLIVDGFFHKWLLDLHPVMKKKQLDAFYELAIDHFFMTISPSTFSLTWLKDYFGNLQQLAHRIHAS